MLRERKIIAIATGDPAGIGPEISLRAAREPTVRAACRTILVGDPALIARHASACGVAAELRSIATVDEADWSDDRINVLTCPQPNRGDIPLSRTSAAAGHASIAFVRAAVKAALAGAVDAVVAAPQNETSIALAGIPFDGHPSFVARETETDPDDVYLMLCAGSLRIVHATLHQSVRQALALITPERIGRVIRAIAPALRRLGISAPRIAVGGLNPHAGEGGLFGREEIDIIAPAIAAAATEGIAVRGPFGPDILLQQPDVDAFVVMLHDHGHIPVKLLAPNGAVAMTIGTPILFASVAHGSAHDIAGRGVADPRAMIEAVLLVSGVSSANPLASSA
jgi:4-hydroxythreonine-4-phosphate dehydrogenase